MNRQKAIEEKLVICANGAAKDDLRIKGFILSADDFDKLVLETNFVLNQEPYVVNSIYIGGPLGPIKVTTE